jgi:hypothetical protein
VWWRWALSQRKRSIRSTSMSGNYGDQNRIGSIQSRQPRTVTSAQRIDESEKQIKKAGKQIKKSEVEEGSDQRATDTRCYYQHIDGIDQESSKLR